MNATPKLDRETTATAVRRLRRVEGQVKGVQRMLEEERDCAEIIQQIAAARSALDRVALDLISTGLEQCLRLELRGKAPARSALYKLQKTFMMLR
jgi:DNA-binding FrmR family transcriptional regulator